MSPSKFMDSEVTTKGMMINGPRPSPLKINKDSHLIYKENSPPPKNGGAKRQPVIIYTHSPKVIHAHARDFMALVQKLTGLSHSGEEEEKAGGKSKSKSKSKSEVESNGDEGSEEKDLKINYDESCSVLSDDKFVGEVKQHDSPMYKMSSSCFDAPIFTPNSNEFYTSSARTSDLFQSPAMANSISPSFMDFMKGFHNF